MRDDLFKLQQDLVTIQERFHMTHSAPSNVIIHPFNATFFSCQSSETSAFVAT